MADHANPTKQDIADGRDGIHQVIGQLQHIRSRSRGLLILQRLSLMLAWAIGVLVALIAIDYALRLPSAVRLVLLLAGLGTLGYFVVNYLRGAVQFAPSLTQLALRVEQIMPALSGRLASSVEFAAGGIDRANPLAARAVRDTQSRLLGEDVRRVLDPRRTWRDVGLLALALAAAALLGATNPAHAVTGLKRIVLPYSDTKWPARTGVMSLMDQLVGGRDGQAVHPRGQALPLRAEVTRGDPAQRVEAWYRLRAEGDWQDWQRIVLTHQGGSIHERLIDTNADEVELYFATSDDRTASQRIELVPPPAVLRASLDVRPPAYAADHVPGLRAELGQGLDDRAVTETPSLAGSEATLRFELNKPLPVPDDPDALRDWLGWTFGWPDDPQPSFSVDPDNPQAWTLRWTLQATRSLPLNLVDEHGLANAESISYRIETVEDQPPSITITQPQSDEVVLPTAVVPLAAEARDDVALASLGLEAHLQSAGRTMEQAMEVPPAWNQRQVAEDPAAVAQAELDLGPLHVKEGDVVIVTGVADDVYGRASRTGRNGPADADPAEADANADAGTDDGAAGGPAMRDPVRSPPRRLRVISEVDFATQLRRQLGAVRQNAIRIEALQGELQDEVIDHGVAAGGGLDRAQAQIGERIAAQREAVEQIEGAVRSNRLNDQQLAEILQQTQDLLDFAGKASTQAVEAIERRGPGNRSPSDEASQGPGEPRAAGAATQPAAQGDEQAAPRGEQGAQASEQSAPRGEQGAKAGEQGAQSGEQGAQAGEQSAQRGEQSGAQSGQQSEQRGEQGEGRQPDEDASPTTPMPEAAPQDQPIVEAQQTVRDELTDLIKLLDRDEDTWVMRRQLESMLKEQAAVEQQTGRLGQETMGQRREDLTDEQRGELDRITQKQQDLADQARELIEELRDRATALEPVDPQSAQGMRQAADAAEQSQLDRDMQQAAQQAQQNQMTSAQASQQRAQGTMQRMLETMDQTKQARAQELIRKLASLVESITRLITVQENELNALGLAMDAKDFGGLDRSMIRLNQNTQAVAAEARSAGQEARRIARNLDRAADAQGTAIAALRATPPAGEEARVAEERALELLKEAKTLADELQKQTEQDEVKRRREELMAQYRQFAEQQVAVRTATLPLAEVGQLDRRQLVEARRLGSQQDEIRVGLNGLRDVTSEIIDSPIFAHVHRLIDQWSATITESLAAGTANVDVTDRQQQIADSLGRLIAALEESLVPPDEFDKGDDGDQQQQGDQQGQQPQPLLPPVAQLKLLQGLQEQVYELTRALDGRDDLDEAQVRTRLREVGQQQRELQQLGEQMLEQLQNQQRPTEAEPEPEPESTTTEPTPEPGPEPVPGPDQDAGPDLQPEPQPLPPVEQGDDHAP